MTLGDIAGPSGSIRVHPGNRDVVCELCQLLRKTLKFEIKLSKRDKSTFKGSNRPPLLTRDTGNGGKTIFLALPLKITFPVEQGSRQHVPLSTCDPHMINVPPGLQAAHTWNPTDYLQLPGLRPALFNVNFKYLSCVRACVRACASCRDA